MKKFYHLEYQETEQTFTDMFRLYYDDRSYYFFKVIVTIGGLLALFIQLSMGASLLSLTFIVKFLFLWAVAYVAGYLLVKHILTGVNAQTALKTGKEKYQMRVEKCGTDLCMAMDFRREDFTVTFQSETKEYSYKEVIRMLQNDEFYGLVVGGVYGQKEMIGFPADAVNSDEKEGFHADLAEKCTNVAGGFRKL